MTFEEYNEKIRIINTDLQDIAERTKNLAILGVANAANPNFVTLMQRYDRLIKQSSRLTEDMMKKLQIDNDAQS
ncbi:hypothetical protein ACA369_07745 [Enterobacter kobei]|uniref:hypothetical protein n=1 Tax=Enterobacter kobei TaxID=208224 RepID=UPI003BA3BCE2